MTDTTSTAPATLAPTTAKNPRKALMTGLAGLVLLGGLGYGVYWALVGSAHIETDNAYVNADTALVTPQIAGVIQTVPVRETQMVKAGELLVQIDPADAKLAVEQAEAELARTERRVKGYFATNSGLSAQVEARNAEVIRAEAQLASARSDLERARIDFDRRKALSSSGAVSGDELTRSRNALTQAEAATKSSEAALSLAQANQRAAEGSLQTNQVLTENTTVDTNPEVAAARTKLSQAKLTLSRTQIVAAVDGVVTKKNVQIGQQIAPGANLMQIVPLQSMYVDANFKEVQLKKIHIGQKVELYSDLYGKDVVYHGKVTGLAGGTGAAFALIPAQNATGNWIKVVQRLPVRVSLDPSELKSHPLRVGLSMTATVDTRSN